MPGYCALLGALIGVLRTVPNKKLVAIATGYVELFEISIIGAVVYLVFRYA